MDKITEVNLSDLSLPSFQLHSDIPQPYIHEIADSIKTHGIIEPLIVRHTDNGKEIVCGCVRYQASILAGRKSVPCIIKSLSPEEAESLKIHENLKRLPTNDVDQGYFFIMLIEKFNWTAHSISDDIGKSRPYVSQRISLVRHNSEITKAVKDGSITISHARELIRLDDPFERKRLLHSCQYDGLPVNLLQRCVEDELRRLKYLPPAAESPPDEIHSDNSPYLTRNCEACLNPFEIVNIRHVFFCIDCRKAILDAISDERNKSSPNTPEKDS
ncbi:MAG: ParB/RepB/Spo0J family partition protein [Bacteroidetes bacterium]|nr:ParB/RepB/Spo0J family partition protein [Bacteroidota bacterium]